MQFSQWTPHSIPFILFSGVCAMFLAGCRQPLTWTPKPPYGATTGPNDFDLTSAANDANGSPDRPEWAPQVQKPENVPPTPNSSCKKQNIQPYQAGCTDQSKFLVQDTGRGLNGLACDLFGDPSAINGHVDWTVATARGSLGFLNFADDWDYNLLLLPDSDAGLTENNNALPDESQRYIEIEFDSRELEDRFQTKWWQDFASLARQGLQDGNFNAVDEHMHSGAGYAYGSIYGLFGLDCEHGCRSEFHPAYAVAIQVLEAREGNRWAIFARNSGDEGFCSHLNHRLDLGGQAMQMLLPYKSSKPPTSIEIQQSATSINPADPKWCPRFTFSPDQGEMIEIPLPPPDADGLAEVVVQFTWPDGAEPMPSKKIDKAQAQQKLANERAARLKAGTASVEERIGDLYRTLTPQRKSMQMRENQRRERSLYTQQNTPLACSAPETTKLTMKAAEQPGPAPRKRTPLSSHADKGKWDKDTIESLCLAYEHYEHPDGIIPADTLQKLKKLCSDERGKK